jgi:putative ABC transport system permease protein
MGLLKKVRDRLFALLRKDDFERELSEELRYHIEKETEKNVRAGMSPDEARRAANHDFGHVESMKEDVRDETGVRPFEELLRDVHYGFRTLRRSRGFAIAVVLTLALGIGANTAIFTVVDTVLLRPLPYRDADELSLLWGRMSETEVSKAPWSGADLLDFRDRSEAFQEFAGASGFNSTLTGDFDALPIQLGFATTNFFDVLGVAPVAGRTFEESDYLGLSQDELFGPDATPPTGVAVLSHELWMRQFGGDPSIIGQTMQVNAAPVEIIGVAPPGFRLYLPADAAMPKEIDAWSAIPMDFSTQSRDQQWLTIVGRLTPGTSHEQAQSEMDGIAAQLRQENQFHENVGMEIDVVPMQADVVGHAKPVLLALLGAVGFVLLIACANVGNLLLVRGQSRAREMAIRTALGGRRGRLVRQMLTESAILAALGGLAGLAIAWFGVDILLALRPDNLPRVDEIGMNSSVLAFAAGATLLAAFLFGLIPALQASRPDVIDSLRERGHSVGRRLRRLHNGLVVTEVALSLVLLVGAGLMLRTFFELSQVRPGFVAENALTVNVTVPFFKYQGEGEKAAFHAQLRDRIEALPGVKAVGAVTPLPLAGGGQFWFGPWALTEDEEEWSRNEADYRPALEGVFEAMGTRLLAGRPIQQADNRPDASPVVVIDEKMADRAWPDEEAIGKQILIMRPAMEAGSQWERYWAEVVGVVEHVRYDDLRSDGREIIYIPHANWSFADLNYVIRTSVDPASLGASVRSIIREADPDIPASTVRPLGEYVSEALAPTRFAMILIWVFAGVALFLSAVGLYGVISYSVRQRTHEIGVRMALGAERPKILRLVGLVGAAALARLISSLLFGVSSTDPVTYGLIAILLGGVAALACYVPAARATRVDPLMALRTD